jgi:hypothetical protein
MKMKWLEIIELQTVEDNYELLDKVLDDLIETIDYKGNPPAIKTYRHKTVETDIYIKLLHDSEQADIRESLLGLSLASALRKFGLVNHNIWIERRKCHDK